MQVSEYIESFEISIPIELARFTVWQRNLVNKYETNQLIRAVGTWLLLKHLTTSGHIQRWNYQKDYLLKLCKCSDSVFRHRIKLLADLKLLTLYKADRKNDSIRICSWETLSKNLAIDDKSKKLTVTYNLNDNQKIHEWIIATEIQDSKDRQDFVINAKLKKNPEVKTAVTAALIAAGADRNKLGNDQYFLMWLRVVYRDDFIQASDIHEALMEVRPDNNRSVRGIASAWCCKHPMTVSYWKAVLSKNRIIDVSKLQVQSENRVRHKYCRVVWLKNSKQTLLCLCDQIELMRPRDPRRPLALPAAA